MAQFPVTGETVFPTFNNVAATAQEGKRWSEPKVTEWIKAIVNNKNYVASGMLVSGVSGTLNFTIPSGTALLQGYFSIIPATVVTAAASATTYVFLRLLRDVNGFVTDAVFETQLTTTPPADSMFICSLTAGVSTITSVKDLAVRSIAQMAEELTIPLATISNVLTSGTSPVTIYTCPAGKRAVLKNLMSSHVITGFAATRFSRLRINRVSGGATFLRSLYQYTANGTFIFNDKDNVENLVLLAGDTLQYINGDMVAETATIKSELTGIEF